MRNALAFLILVSPPALLAQDRVAESIVQHAQAAVDAGEFSGVVFVAKDGRTLVSRAWGLADREANVPNTPDTRFNIGSINKAFTRAAIEGLARQGKLSLTDIVRKHLPDYPSDVADRITLEQLLEHRSGLGDIFGPKYTAAPPSRLRELSDFLPLFVDEPLRFEPGTSEQYSNAGYIVLGLIIERVSGEKYRHYVTKHIFAPAGMKNTGFYAVDEKVARRARGYTKRGPDGPLPERRLNEATLPGRPSSAGGAYATAEDLARFVQWNAGRPDGRSEAAFGIAGGAPGINAAIEVTSGWTVITMANYDPPAAGKLARGIMGIVLGRKEGAEGDGPTIVRRRHAPAPAGTELPSPVAVPLTPAGHLMAVEVKVNGQGPFRFAIDTGAGGIRVGSKLASALALEEVGQATSGDPSGRNRTQVPLVRIDSMEIGAARFTRIQASAGPLLGESGADGVIGLTLFGSLTVTLDYPKRELRLSRDPLPATGEHVVAFTSERGIPEIDLDAGGVKIRADLDSGSPAMLSVPPSFGVQFASEPRLVGRARTANNEFEIRAAELRGDLRVAGWTHASPTVDLVDHFPVANLGSRFMRNYAVTFDMPNKRVSFEK